MKTISFVISEMKNEKRRAILPEEIEKLRNKKSVFIEKSYAEVLGISDEDYLNTGARIVTREEALQKDIICDLKVGSASYLKQLSPGQIIFGWVHAEANKKLTNLLVKKELSVIAWEDMFDEGRHVFWKNNYIAGEAGVIHAFTLFGKVPRDCKVALIGRGNVSMGAHQSLSALGADVKIYNRETADSLRKELADFDMVVNGVLWDKSREDYLINKEDLKKMKKPSMIVDISADEGGAIETSRITSFENPTYLTEGVIHYVVNHTPTIFNYSVSEKISDELVCYIDLLIEDRVKENKVLRDAMMIEKGKVLNDQLLLDRNNS